jgi:hypothetical protein
MYGDVIRLPCDSPQLGYMGPRFATYDTPDPCRAKARFFSQCAEGDIALFPPGAQCTHYVRRGFGAPIALTAARCFRMALHAMSRPPRMPTFRSAVRQVFYLGTQPEMRRVDTRRVITARAIMEHEQALRNGAATQKPRHAMRRSALSSPDQAAISARTDLALPQPAFRGGIHSGPESHDVGGGILPMHRGDSVPVYARVLFTPASGLLV